MNKEELLTDWVVVDFDHDKAVQNFGFERGQLGFFHRRYPYQLVRNPEKYFRDRVKGNAVAFFEKNGRTSFENFGMAYEGQLYHVRGGQIYPQGLINVSDAVGAITPDGRLCILGKLEGQVRIAALIEGNQGRRVAILSVDTLSERPVSLYYDRNSRTNGVSVLEGALTH